ncbi:MAG: methyltransferase, partial [Algicola sp.]|nr:methyltransferase [Algicola sp.]
MSALHQCQNKEALVSSYSGCFKALERISAYAMAMVLVDLGWDNQSTDSLKQRQVSLNIVDKYTRLFAEMTEILKRTGLIDGDDPHCCWHPEYFKATKTFSWQQEIKLQKQKYPLYASHFDLLACCLDALPDVITGKLLATEVMFSATSMPLVENYYKNNPVKHYYHLQLAEFVCQLVKHKQALLGNGRKVRILEVGAGTGGASEAIFQALNDDCVKYFYTDISKRFLVHGEKKYGKLAPYPFFQIFDIEQSPSAQNIPLHSMDIVIGANVVHASKNIVNSLSNIKSLLNPQGTLLLNELSCASNFQTLTFGLLDGWGQYEDAQLRLPNSPVLSSTQWQSVFQQAKFDDFEVIEADALLGHQIIMAKNTPQKLVSKPKEKPPCQQPPNKEAFCEETVAIIGYSGSFGKAGNCDDYWAVLRDAQSLLENHPHQRWAPWFAKNKFDKEKIYCKKGSFIEDIDCFDPSFFNISSYEAANIDPQ